MKRLTIAAAAAVCILPTIAFGGAWTLSVGSPGQYQKKGGGDGTVEVEVLLAVSSETGDAQRGLKANNFAANIRDCDDRTCVWHVAKVVASPGNPNVQEQIPGVYLVRFSAPYSDAAGYLGTPGYLAVAVVTTTISGPVTVGQPPRLSIVQHAQQIVLPRSE